MSKKKIQETKNKKKIKQNPDNLSKRLSWIDLLCGVKETKNKKQKLVKTKPKQNQNKTMITFVENSYKRTWFAVWWKQKWNKTKQTKKPD